jgi:hypothetical protein
MPKPPPPKQTTYEYTYSALPNWNPDIWVDTLNEYGAEGWRPIICIKADSKSSIVFFEREVTEK